MEELFRTNDLVFLSFALAVLRDAGVEPFVFDEQMSVTEGAANLFFPRRVLVLREERALAEGVLADLRAEYGG